jgi:hypothetical protein
MGFSLFLQLSESIYTLILRTEEIETKFPNTSGLILPPFQSEYENSNFRESEPIPNVDANLHFLKHRLQLQKCVAIIFCGPR